MITEDYVSFEIAKLLKEKGFDADITTYRDDFIQYGNIVIPLQECLSKDRIKTPTLQMAMKWLREEKNIDCTPHLLLNGAYSYVVTQIKPIDVLKLCHENYNYYEEACEAAIKYCLTNLI